MWSEFVNLTAVVMTLLELQTDPLVPIEIKKAIAQSGNIPGTGNFYLIFLSNICVLCVHDFGTKSLLDIYTVCSDYRTLVNLSFR